MYPIPMAFGRFCRIDNRLPSAMCCPKIPLFEVIFRQDGVIEIPAFAQWIDPNFVGHVY